eukprot:7389012-Prymnesium_polylepis.1
MEGGREETCKGEVQGKSAKEEEMPEYFERTVLRSSIHPSSPECREWKMLLGIREYTLHRTSMRVGTSAYREKRTRADVER